MLDVADLATDAGVPVRLYRPAANVRPPVFVYLHGGGWTTGSPDGADELCRTLAADADCAVASVDYRLAPEHPFPAGLEDCYAATAWVAAAGAELGLDGARVAVGGSSAGANLAIGVTRLARERGMPALAFQLLIYPPTDHAADADVPGVPFRRADMARLWSTYLASPDDGENPLASPLRAADLAGLPPALVITGELDPLSPEAEAYAARLEDAGVPVRVGRYARMPHGFFSSATAAGAAARGEAAAALRACFGD